MAAANDWLAQAQGLSATSAGGTYKGTAATTPDWSGSNGYMGNVQNYMGQGTAAIGASGVQAAGGQAAGPVTAATNIYATAENPYLQSMVDKAGRDQRSYYDQFIAPKFSAGSSFGNSGLGFLEVNERNNQAQTFADKSAGLRFDEYGLRAKLAEDGALRQDNLGKDFAGRTDLMTINRADAADKINTDWAGRQDTLNKGQRDNNLIAGSTYGQLAQNAGNFNYNADFQQFQDQNQQQDKRIDALLRGIGAVNSTPATTPEQKPNPLAGAVGGALTAAQLYQLFNGKK